MSLSQGLLKVLDNCEEPLTKRIKIADNALHASKIQMHNKEAFLLKWALNASTRSSSEDLWFLVSKWLSSTEFKSLTQNDISNDDILAIIDQFNTKLTEKQLSNIEKHHIIDAILLICHNNVFQQFFRYNMKLYCELICHAIELIEQPIRFIDFIGKTYMFSKNIVVQDHFSKYFLDILYPVCVKKALQFDNNQQVFNETVQIIQKCIFQGNTKHFQTFLDHLFDENKEDKNNTELPNIAFKYLASSLHKDSPTTAIIFKLFFSAFYDNLKNSEHSYKFLIVVIKLLNFDVSKDFNISIPFEATNINISKALQILLVTLDVLSTKNITDCTVSGVTFVDFLRNILKSLISLKVKNVTVFEIIHKCISINPLVIEPLTSSLIPFVMIGNHEEIKETYEKLVTAIFEVFAKLHRMENFIAKVIPALKSSLTMQNKMESSSVYDFKGVIDIEILSETSLSVSDIVTENILDCFTKSLNGLASWQVINVFKTMLYHLKNTVAEYADVQFDNNSNSLTFLELLGTFTTCLLQSVKIADHTVPPNVVTKFVKGLEELRDVLRNLGLAILKREHNHVTMRTFLNLSFTWAEIYITLTHYSMNNEVQISTVTDSMYSAANLRYLHSYMHIKDWQLIAQRITNFGEYPCKKLLQKLYIQKIKAMLLFEKNLNDDITNNVVKTLQSHMEDTWLDLLLDRFIVNYILPKMDKPSLIFLAEHLIDNDNLLQKNHIVDSVTLTNAAVYVLMSKINKLFKMKRKHDAESNKNLSSQVFSSCPDELFFSRQNFDINEVMENLNVLYENLKINTLSSIGSKEDKLRTHLSTLKKLPFIYSDINIQKIVLWYLFSLRMDIVSCSEPIKLELESLIIGTLQACKYPLTEIFKIEILGAQILCNFQRHKEVFALIVDNVFKHEKSILNFEPTVLYLTTNLEDYRHLNCSMFVLQSLSKVKKSKMDSTTKEKASKYKDKLLTKISKLVSKSDYLIEAYAVCLRHYISTEKETEILKKLLDKLGSYVDYSLENISDDNKKGCAILFATVLQNKTKLKDIKDDVVLKIWNACKKVNIGEENSHLVMLIVTLIPNEEFEMLVTDLFQVTEKSIKNEDYSQLIRQLKTWESILNCDVNPVKMKTWQEVLEKLIYELLYVLRHTDYNDELSKGIVHLEQNIIQASHFILSSPLIDMFIMTVQVLMRYEDQHFESVFQLSISTLELLLKYRNAIIMDRLPPFLQQYRLLLKSVCSKSNSDENSIETVDVKKASNCVHSLEKVTKHLVACKKDMGRIAVFLIADILERYEQINLYPNVKLHLNNCIYSLISLCDQHAVSYLMRVLSNASTEMFKIMYEHYKRYYMFTGKV